MVLTAIALVCGLAAGLLAGGERINRHVADLGLRAWSALVGGLALQLLVHARGGTLFVLASYCLLLVFVVANLQLIGMPIVMLGLGLNLLVIAANSGMPVRSSALVAADLAGPDDVSFAGLSAERHLERPSDRLTALGDVVPVPPLRQVVSFGDLILLVGVADVAANLARRRGSKSLVPALSEHKVA